MIHHSFSSISVDKLSDSFFKVSDFDNSHILGKRKVSWESQKVQILKNGKWEIWKSVGGIGELMKNILD